MAVITKIEVQKRTKERFNIYIDKGQGEEYGFSVNQVTLIKHGLQKGLEIDEVELANILYNEEVQKHICKQFLIYPIKCGRNRK